MPIAFNDFLVDRISATLRWLVLFGIAVALAESHTMTEEAAVALLAGGLWAVLQSVLAQFNRRILAHRIIALAGDYLIALGIFFFSGMFSGSVVWVGLLPLISDGLFASWRKLLLIVGLALLGQGVLAYFFVMDLAPAFVTLALLALVYIPVGFMVSYLGTRLEANLRRQQRIRSLTQREARRAQQEHSSRVYQLIAALNASLNYQRVLDTALDLGYTAIDGKGDKEHLVSAVFLFARQNSSQPVLQVGSARRFTPADARITLPGREGLIGKTIDEGQSFLGEKLLADPELGKIVALRSCTVAYCVPLRLGLDTFGVLLFAHPNPEFFTPDRREILNVIGSQAVVAIQNARLYHDLELEKERMLEIQEEARKKLARDLHDGPTQSVAALAMRVNFARRLMERDAKAASEELYKVEDLARRTTKEIRHMLFTLRPLVLESQGLVAALESMAEKMHETYHQNVLIEADQKLVSQIEMNRQGVIFYIAEEAINNARKHAKAAHIWVRLKSMDKDIAVLEIEDDGVGFNLDAVDSNYESRGSLGMVNMRERTELVNGVLQIASQVGKGTRITVIIPLTEDATDRLRHGL